MSLVRNLRSGDVVISVEDVTFDGPVTVASNNGRFVVQEPRDNPHPYGPRQIAGFWTTSDDDQRECLVVGETQ
jgi:hypothetical protein